MSHRSVLVLSVLVAMLVAAVAPTRASADATLTPTLGPLGRHVEAELLLRDLVSVLPDDVRARISGIYVAFTATPVDVISQAACDDDGDDVIVLSDAMLVLLEYVTHAQARDVGNSRTNVVSLAAHYAKDQRAGERLLPPGPGAFESSDSRAVELVHTARFREALSGVLAHELSIFARSELTCAHPTATHERGDDVWTPEEAELAREIATRLYGKGRARGREEDAVLLTVASNGDAVGYTGWLAFLAAMDADGGHPVWSYQRQRPDPARRVEVAERALTGSRSRARHQEEH